MLSTKKQLAWTRRGLPCWGAAWVGIIGFMGVSSLASGATVPDEEKAQIDTAGIESLAASPDGSVIVGLTSGGAAVRFFDAWQSDTLDDSGSGYQNALTDGCDSPHSVFIGAGVESGDVANFVVHLVCGDSTDADGDGQLYQFILSDNVESSSALSFSAGSYSAHADTAAMRITAAAISDDGETLFLADQDATSTGSTVYQLSAVSVEATPTAFGTITTTGSSIKLMRYDATNQRIIAVDDGGYIYALNEGSSAVSYNSCGSDPHALELLSTTKGLLIDATTTTHILDLSTAPPICTDGWTLDYEGYATARILSDGAGVEADAVYIRTSSGSGGGSLLAFDTNSIIRSPTSPTRLHTVTTSTGGSTVDCLAGSALSRIFLGTSSGTYVFGSGPYLTATSLSQPVSISESSPTITLELTSDETVTELWYDSVAPYESSSSGVGSLGSLIADTPLTVEIDTSTLTDLSDGLNTIFIFAKDAEDNLGWMALRVNKATAPDAASGFTVLFGDQRLYLQVEIPSDDDSVTGYDLLIASATFSVPEEGADQPPEWIADAAQVPSMTIGGTTYDTLSEWPISLTYSTETDADSDWVVVDDILQYTLESLENGVTYDLCIRPVSEGVAGAWTEVVSQAPEETCGATCLAEDAGGFCSVIPEASKYRGKMFPRTFWSFGIPSLFLVVVRRKTGRSSKARTQ